MALATGTSVANGQVEVWGSYSTGFLVPFRFLYFPMAIISVLVEALIFCDHIYFQVPLSFLEDLLCGSTACLSSN